MKGVQCYELFGGIALKNHAFLFVHVYVPGEGSLLPKNGDCTAAFTFYIYIYIKIKFVRD